MPCFDRREYECKTVVLKDLTSLVYVIAFGKLLRCGFGEFRPRDKAMKSMNHRAKEPGKGSVRRKAKRPAAQMFKNGGRKLHYRLPRLCDNEKRDGPSCSSGLQIRSSQDLIIQKRPHLNYNATHPDIAHEHFRLSRTASVSQIANTDMLTVRQCADVSEGKFPEGRTKNVDLVIGKPPKISFCTKNKMWNLVSRPASPHGYIVNWQDAISHLSHVIYWSYYPIPRYILCRPRAFLLILLLS
ncbi:hypothetical protein CBL_01242 [Carabus blaptoides fortunei]